MPNLKVIPSALTVAGSDSSGGAGIQADLKTFMALGVHGTSVVTCLTAQNPKRVFAIEAASPRFVRRQLAAVFASMPPRAVKIGMVFSSGIIREIASFMARPKYRPQLIIDPVLVSTSGRRLLLRNGTKVLVEKLFPLAKLITPNVPEAELLSGAPIHQPEDLRLVAKLLHARYGCAVLVKGGHLAGTVDSADFFYDGHTEMLLRARRIQGVKTHGTGCTYSAAIAGYLALGKPLALAVRLGKEFTTNAIARSVRVDGNHILNWKT